MTNFVDCLVKPKICTRCLQNIVLQLNSAQNETDNGTRSYIPVFPRPPPLRCPHPTYLGKHVSFAPESAHNAASKSFWRNQNYSPTTGKNTVFFGPSVYNPVGGNCINTVKAQKQVDIKIKNEYFNVNRIPLMKQVSQLGET